VESFNLFGGLGDAAVVALLNVYLRATRADFRRAKFLDFVKAFVFSPVLAFSPVMLAHTILDALKFTAGRLLGRSSANPVQRFLRRHHRALYFHCRYLGLQSCLRYADAVISSHGKILGRLPRGAVDEGKPVRNLGVLYPEFDVESVLAGLMSGKQLFLEMTGTITAYRRACIRRVDRAISSLGMGQVFGHCRSFPFASTGMQVVLERGAYSLHPPQSPDWPYCSPMRIYRALAVEGNLPVLMKQFAQHPIEEVCFVWADKYSIVDLYDMYHDRRSTFEVIDRRLSQYNQIARVRNDDCIQAMSGLDRIAEAVIASNGVSAPERVDRFSLGEVEHPTMLPID
jgi:hypothetical protein